MNKSLVRFFGILGSVFIMVLSVSCASGGYKGYQGPKQVVAVSVFTNATKQKLSKEFLGALTDHFMTELIKSGRFSVVERQRLEEILKEHELGMTGLLKTSDAIQIGKLLQAPYVIIPSISNFSAEKNQLLDDTVFGYNRINIKILVNCRVISTASGASVGAANAINDTTRNVVRVSLDSQTSILKYGGSFDDLDPAVKEELMKAVQMMTQDLYRQNF
ncbi:MAG: CsgG/HfaB family protein [Spirochaetota bacterium]|jgi:curli biogenesis system outer membrane secretion channel CsgG